MKWDNEWLMVRDTSGAAAMGARKGLRTLAIALAMWAALAGGVARADTIVVPNSLETTEGNTANSFPFSAFGPPSTRYQQVFAASEFDGPVCITEIAFRPDASSGSAFTETIPDIQINLSTTTAAVGALSATFEDNVGGDDKVVRDRGPLPLSSSNTGPAGGPKDFDIIIPLTTSFSYDPSVGNLLLDVRNFSAQLTTPFDAESNNSISRMITIDVDRDTGFPDFQPLGLVTQFTFTPGECSGSEQGALIVDLDPDIIQFTVEPYEDGEGLEEQFITAYIKLDGLNPADIEPDAVTLSLSGVPLTTAASSAPFGNLLFVTFPATPIVSNILGIEEAALEKVEVDVTRNLIKVVVATQPTNLAPPDLIEPAVSVESSSGTDAMLVIQNRRPVADAGGDQTEECTSADGTEVHLDGTGSTDPDDDPLTFTWTGPFGNRNGETVTAKLPLGVHEIFLTVDDGGGGTDSDMTVATIRDTTPPTINYIRASPKVLWHANHKMVPIHVPVSASDICDEAPACRIIAVSSNEPPGHKEPDWQFTGDLTLKLRAERSRKGTGRTYAITVQCTDASGNSSMKSVTVRVPHVKEKLKQIKEKLKKKLKKLKKKRRDDDDDGRDKDDYDD